MHSRGASKGSRARIAKRNFGTVESNRASSVERTPSGAPLHFEDVKANAGRKISALLDPRLAPRIDCKIARIAKPGKKPCKRDPRARDWRAGLARGGMAKRSAITKSRNLNLPLAARPCVGHIRPHGAVAEWLKAAVC